MLLHLLTAVILLLMCVCVCVCVCVFRHEAALLLRCHVNEGLFALLLLPRECTVDTL